MSAKFYLNNSTKKYAIDSDDLNEIIWYWTRAWNQLYWSWLNYGHADMKIYKSPYQFCIYNIVNSETSIVWPATNRHYCRLLGKMVQNFKHNFLWYLRKFSWICWSGNLWVIAVNWSLSYQVISYSTLIASLQSLFRLLAI